ncbi:MAG: hypothetical protein U1D55_07305 [Phycisphaerae bacterium]
MNTHQSTHDSAARLAHAAGLTSPDKVIKWVSPAQCLKDLAQLHGRVNADLGGSKSNVDDAIKNVEFDVSDLVNKSAPAEAAARRKLIETKFDAFLRKETSDLIRTNGLLTATDVLQGFEAVIRKLAADVQPIRGAAEEKARDRSQVRANARVALDSVSAFGRMFGRYTKSARALLAAQLDVSAAGIEIVAIDAGAELLDTLATRTEAEVSRLKLARNEIAKQIAELQTICTNAEMGEASGLGRLVPDRQWIEGHVDLHFGCGHAERKLSEMAVAAADPSSDLPNVCDHAAALMPPASIPTTIDSYAEILGDDGMVDLLQRVRRELIPSAAFDPLVRPGIRSAEVYTIQTPSSGGETIKAAVDRVVQGCRNVCVPGPDDCVTIYFDQSYITAGELIEYQTAAEVLERLDRQQQMMYLPMFKSPDDIVRVGIDATRIRNEAQTLLHGALARGMARRDGDYYKLDRLVASRTDRLSNGELGHGFDQAVAELASDSQLREFLTTEMAEFDKSQGIAALAAVLELAFHDETRVPRERVDEYLRVVRRDLDALPRTWRTATAT